VSYQVGAHMQHQEVVNTFAGLRRLVRVGGATSLYVFETTGPYYLAVATLGSGRGPGGCTQSTRDQALHLDAFR
jgi:hypothetical protein